MRLSLAQNNPNPFKGITEIQYGLPVESSVNLTVHDLEGRSVRTLVDGEQPAGYHLVQWDGMNDLGHAVPGGLYFYRLTADGQEEMRTIVYLR
jgi:flagellar hook assembly protein FlgD